MAANPIANQSGGRSFAAINSTAHAQKYTKTSLFKFFMAGKYFKRFKSRRRRAQSTEAQKTPKIIKHAKHGRLLKLVAALERGDHVNSVDSERRSALFYAALGGHKKCVKELLRRGANPNLKNQDGQTPCHAAALGGRTPTFPSAISTTRNPLKGVYYCGKGVFNCLSHYLHDSQLQRRILEYLVIYGGDLRAQSLTRETPRDIAVRRRMMDVVRMIEEYFQLQTTASGLNIIKGQSMLRPSGSYPRACPYWMHAPTAESLSGISPLATNASLFNRGRNCSTLYDYGFMFPCGSRTSPRSFGGVPEILPAEITKVEGSREYESIDGSVWSEGSWGLNVSVTVRKIRCTDSDGGSSSVMTVEHLLNEMDQLSIMRHPNIILLMAVSCGPTKADMLLAMEPVQTGASLYEQLHQQQMKLSSLEAADLIYDVASAVVYLHTIKGLAHNILSSHAIFLTSNSKAKLCNLFCCQPPEIKLSGKLSSALRLFLPWMSPELMKTRLTSYDNDVYSLGVLLWEVWSGACPWPDLSPPQLGKVLVEEGQRLPITKTHFVISHILDSCFGPPVDRLPAEEFLCQIGYLKTTPL